MSADVPPPGFPVPLRLGDRVVGWLAADVGALAASAPAPAEAPPGVPLLLVPAGALEMLAVRTAKRAFVTIPQGEILYLSSKGGVVTVHADRGACWRDGTLAATEAALDPRRFLRLDHSTVVNVSRIAELIPWTHQRYRLVFADAAKTELMLSRDVGRRLRAALGW